MPLRNVVQHISHTWRIPCGTTFYARSEIVSQRGRDCPAGRLGPSGGRRIFFLILYGVRREIV